MSPYQNYLVQLINNTNEAAFKTFQEAKEETKRLYQAQWEQLEGTGNVQQDPSSYFQYLVDHVEGYVYGGINLQRLRRNPQEILMGLRQNALYTYGEVLHWYFDSAEEYPLLKRYVERMELVRFLLMELLHLLIAEQSSPKNPESE